MAINENPTRVPKHELREVGWSKAIELVKVAGKDGEEFDCATWLHKAKELSKEGVKEEVERHLPGKENGALGDYLPQALQEPVACGRRITAWRFFMQVQGIRRIYARNDLNSTGSERVRSRPNTRTRARQLAKCHARRR